MKDFTPVEDDIHYIASLITKYLKEGPAWTPQKINGEPVASTQQVLLKVSVNQWGIMAFAF